MSVNMSIWYWQMDLHHSFSSVLWTSRYNIIMAHVMAFTGMIKAFGDESLHDFIMALIRSFHESVTTQTEIEHKPRCLSISAAANMTAAPMEPFRRKADIENFWVLLQCETPTDRRKYGARWAVRYVMYLESEGKDMEKEDGRLEAGYELDSNLLVEKFSSANLDDGAAAAAEGIFASTRIQALLKDAPSVVKRYQGGKHVAGSGRSSGGLELGRDGAEGYGGGRTRENDAEGNARYRGFEHLVVRSGELG
ncbi:hypothetical protein SVAN01_02969 [Stagonosporopsis vannaccii]|nr:hypothetical protein SVAN01_02969 [Stagonosporopsis vannaccii]